MEKQANNISCEDGRWNRSSEIKFYFLISQSAIQDTGSCTVYIPAAPPQPTYHRYLSFGLHLPPLSSRESTPASKICSIDLTFVSSAPVIDR